MRNQQRTGITRRGFVKRLGVGGAWAALAGALPVAARGFRPPKIGLQLYAVRGEFAQDVPGTLRRVSAAGYEGVEFWGYGGTPKVFQDYDAEQLREWLDLLGLECCGMHLQPRALEDDRFEQTVAVNKTLGNRYLIVAAAPDRMKSPETIAAFAKWLNDRAEKARRRGMQVGYHAHGFDFVKFDGRTAWELLFSQTSPRVLMQMDVGNCLGGGGDPIAMLRKFPGRTPTIHIKDYEDKTFESDYYREVFRLCEQQAGTRWYIVEMGGPGGRGFAIPVEARQRLHWLGK